MRQFNNSPHVTILLAVIPYLLFTISQNFTVTVAALFRNYRGSCQHENTLIKYFAQALNYGRQRVMLSLNSKSIEHISTFSSDI